MPDFLWPSDNELGIPVLIADREPAGAVIPAVAWGTKSRKSQIVGGIHFYVDDYRFATIWKRPEQLLNSRAKWATEVNYSVFDSTPPAVVVWATYRKRWLARYCQQAGMPVFVDLNVPAHHQEINLLGVPAGWKSYSTRGYENAPELVEAELAEARRHAKTRSVNFLVFGGGRRIAGLCRREGLVHFPYRTAKERT